MVKQASRSPKRLAEKALETLLAVVESAVGALFSFLSKAIGLLAEHTWTLIVLIAGLARVWLMQKMKKARIV